MSLLQQAHLERNLWCYKVLAFVGNTPVFIPIIVLFWVDCGMSLEEVFWLQTLFALAAVILEVPTGMVADRIGKKTSLLMGLGILAIGFTLYAMSRSFIDFLLVEILLALGLGFYSGSDSALLYDTLKALGREGEYQKLEGEATGLRMVSFALSSLAGGVIGDVSFVAAMWASVVGPVLGFGVVCGMVEVQQRPEGKTSFRVALSGYKDLLSQALRFVARHRYVRWQILLYSVVGGSGMWLLWLYQPYMEFTGLEVMAFGLAFAVFNLFSAFCSSRADAVEAKLGERRMNMVMFALQVLPLLCMGWFIGPMSFLFILGHQAVRGFLRPVVTARILRFTFADKRATVLSLCALGSRLFFAITGPLVGWASDRFTMPEVIHGQAVALLLLFFVLTVLYRRIDPKYHRVKQSVTEHQ